MIDVDNELLCSIPTDNEIKSVVFSFGSLKAPGPDGMPAIFCKTYWNLLLVRWLPWLRLFFLVDCLLLSKMNHTFITLIPKCPNPTTIHQYHPISLCNISYKIISKILANRLKSFLPDLITPWQTASIPGRNIQENSILAHEIFHSMHQKHRLCGVRCLKLDMEKEFDKVEWPFILAIFKHFGFSNKWINLINQCISTPTFLSL